MFAVTEEVTDPTTEKTIRRMVAGPYKDGKEAFAWIGYAVERFGKDPEHYEIQESDGEKWSTRDQKDFLPKPPEDRVVEITLPG